MPEEIEVPTEQLHETLNEEAHKAHEHGGHHAAAPEMKWIPMVALSAALVAVLAAISSLLAGHHANEAMLEQIKASDQWSFYQAKGIKSTVVLSKIELLESLGKEVGAEDRKKVADYQDEMKEIKTQGDEYEASSKAHMARHVVLARTVTIFQIAIALAAIAVLTKRRQLWLVGMGLGAIGIVLLAQGLL